MTRFAIRTVRNGQVKIFGRLFTVNPIYDDPPYDGRWEGRRFAFGLYYVGGILENFVSLYGTERLYRARGDEWENMYDAERRITTDDGGAELWAWWDADPDAPSDEGQS